MEHLPRLGVGFIGDGAARHSLDSFTRLLYIYIGGDAQGVGASDLLCNFGDLTYISDIIILPAGTHVCYGPFTPELMW